LTASEKTIFVIGVGPRLRFIWIGVTENSPNAQYSLTKGYVLIIILAIN
jgi:hypothetical protein